jgi:TetR/AcrR family transcriptional regulator
MAEDSYRETTILDAARRRFAYFGFSKATMEEIAADAGLAKASLYYYYPTKEQLFEAVVLLEQGLFARDIQQVLAGSSTAGEKLRQYAERRLGLFQGLVNLGMLSLQSSPRTRLRSWQLLQDFEQTELGLLNKILSAGIADGEFALAHPERAARLLLNLLQGLRLRIVRGASGPSLQESTYADLRKEIDFFLTIFIQGIRRTQPLRGTPHG